MKEKDKLGVAIKFFDDLLNANQPFTTYEENSRLNKFRNQVTCEEKEEDDDQYSKFIWLNKELKLDLKEKSDGELLCMADILAYSEFKIMRKLIFDNLIAERDNLNKEI